MRWLSFLFWIGAAFAQNQLSICAVFKNEAPFLREWIEFHKMQGVEHFFLYNNQSEDAFQEVLHPYLERGEATLIDWDFSYRPVGIEWVKIQRAAYMDAIEKFKDGSIWMAFLDIDEFLFCPSGESLPSFLSCYEEFGGVCVNWLLFGTSDIQEIAPGSLLIETLTRCSPYNYPLNFRVKSIVRPARVIGCYQAHCFQYSEPFFAVNSARMPMSDRLNGPSICHDQIRINHYWTRTERYFHEQKIQSRKMRRDWDTEDVLRERATEINVSSDFAIQQFIPELKKRLL
ncbi:MAG TPA: glycosyltransferase family 92 protein [Chlamydiales bacterium]|jgi:hypothetical protein|nr:glycosyltransferase family 92 protein [Chlamydiales bacterium]